MTEEGSEVYTIGVTVEYREVIETEIEEPGEWDDSEQAAKDRAIEMVKGDLRRGGIEISAFDVTPRVDHVYESGDDG